MSKFTKLFLGVLLIILISLWAAIVDAPDKNFHLSALDVGQGDSILVQTPEGQNILIDGGPDNRVVDQLSQKIPFYNRRIEAVFLTHPHADHLFGLIEVLRRYQVGMIYVTGVSHTTNEYLEFLKLIKEKNLAVKNVKAGDIISFGETKFEVFWPQSELVGKTVENLNNSSLAMKVNYRNFSAMLLGDLEKDGQAEMLKKEIGPVNLVKISHHGSANGIDADLLEQLKPSLAIISVGADNKYGHPAFSVVSELEKRDITIKRTDRDGIVAITSDGEKFW